MNTEQSYAAALCIYREARNQTRDAMRGVYWVLQHRIADGRWGNSATSVVTWPWQFSSFNKSDPNASVYPKLGDHAWMLVCDVVDEPGEDNVPAATHYYDHSIPAPYWAGADRLVASIGAFSFFKNVK